MSAAIPAAYASLQAAGAVAGLMGSAGLLRPTGFVWAVTGLFLLAVSLCLADPAAILPLLWLGHMALYLGLSLVFGRSLRPGRIPVATRLAQHLHTTLSLRRFAYTRAVTWMWMLYFAAQLAACIALALWPASAVLRWITMLHLPLALALAACELAFRGAWFRGQPHGSAIDMLRAFRRQA